MNSITYDPRLFWGKARPVDAEGPRFHPLPFHMLDVAAVADAMARARPRVLTSFQELGLEKDQALGLTRLVAAFHDLGKFARSFQAKVDHEYLLALFGPSANTRAQKSEHDLDGLHLWTTHLSAELAPRIWPDASETLRTFIGSGTGHHGRAVAATRPFADEAIAPQGIAAAKAAARTLCTLLLPERVTVAEPDEDAVRRLSFLIAGFVTVADWVGSNQRFFPYAECTVSVEAYWELALERARTAVAESGLDPAPSGGRHGFSDLTGLAVRPTPMQQLADTVDLPKGPTLFLLEDTTGSGKTEAAQILVNRLMADGRAQGAFWAMPTQATANAMYARQADILHRLFAEGSNPSLALAHGQARLHPAFRSVLSQQATHADEHPPPVWSDENASAACAAFLAQDRRAALLAELGAGTIDQAFLAALPSRFNAVRLFGLAEKVLVCDEVHSFDAYMGAELEGLLRFQAGLGGCAIVLSATLPQAIRNRLVRAWREGLGALDSSGPLVQSTDYPLMTTVSASDVREKPSAPAPGSKRTLPIRTISSEDAAVATLVEAAAKGAASVWIRNTVDDVLRAETLLCEEGLSPLVFHARFAQSDRQSIESRVMQLFGKEGSEEDRKGAVLLATQVVEQSLDLDFDVMISDLAPIDLLIQRAGRYRRHRARDGVRPNAPDELVVLCPVFQTSPPKDYCSGRWAGTLAVYDDPAILWRTQAAIEETERLVIPTDLRACVERVYAADAPTPPALQLRSTQAEGAQKADRSIGQQAVLNPDYGYDAEAQNFAWEREEAVLTRLGAPQTTLRLARLEGDAFRPWAEGADEVAWALSEVRVSAHRVPVGSAPEGWPKETLNAACAQWGRWERDRPDVILLPLREGGDGWVGELTSPRGTGIALRYSDGVGLSFGAD